MYSQIKIHNKYLNNITKIDKYKKLNNTFTTEHITEHNYTLVNQAINMLKSNKGLTKEVKHISNNNIQRYKGRKTRDRKMNKQKIQLNYKKNHYAEQNKDNIIKDKNQLNDNNIRQLSASVLDLLKIFYNTRNDNQILKHSMHTLKIPKSNSTNINTIKETTKHKQQTPSSKFHTNQQKYSSDN